MYCLIIIITVLLMYYRSINYGYIIDDEAVFLGNVEKSRKTPNIWVKLWQHYRGTKYTDNRMAHGITILIHMITCILIYFAFGCTQVSFITAMLFSINPVNNEGAIWISGKHYALATTFILLGFCFVQLSPICYSLAVLTSINSLLFPLIFLFKGPKWLSLMLIIIPFIYSLNKTHHLVIKSRINEAPEVSTKITFKKLIIYFKSLGYYFWLCLFPIRIGMFHEYLHTYGLSKKETEQWYKPDVYLFLGITLFIVTIYHVIFNFCPVIFGLVWFVLFSSQWCNIIMINHPITERYIYLPNIGLMFSLAILINNTPFLWIFLTFYAVRLFYFLPAYKNMMSFWESNISNFPKVALGYNQLGLAYFNYGNHGTSLDTFVQGVQYREDDFKLNYNIANLLISYGKPLFAKRFLEIAIKSQDNRNSVNFWSGQLNTLKNVCVQQGVQIEGSPL